MTAFDLIDSIFSRPAWGSLAGNMRGLTREQLVYLRDLIDADPEGGAVRRGGPGVTMWMPAGRHKYQITEDLHGERHTITRWSNIAASDTGRLF